MLRAQGNLPIQGQIAAVAAYYNVKDIYHNPKSKTSTFRNGIKCKLLELTQLRIMVDS